MVKDITERKLAEKELSESQEMFSKAFQVGPAGMTITRISDGNSSTLMNRFVICSNWSEWGDRTYIYGIEYVVTGRAKKNNQQQIESGGLKIMSS